LGVKLRFSNCETKIDCTVHPNLTGIIPATFVECNAWIIPEGIKSADENFNIPNSIDIVLAADALLEFVAMIRRHGQEIIQFYRIQS
jgi:hypothetical protein